MDTNHVKPRLLFFQYNYDERLPKFLLIHKREHVKCLSEFFDVTVIHEDCDYQRVCDQYQPDITLFESGVNHETCQRLDIRNTRSNPEIPKIGLHHGDGFCNARAGFLSDMDHWGIDTFFTISTTAAEHTPEIADRLFVWPVFIDSEVNHDYNLWKSIPVLLTGNANQFYPWRKKVNALIANHYPTLIIPHPGYVPRKTSIEFMVGENYARTINAAHFVPACGTVAKEAVRKHFEVPGCRSCLITERSPALEAAGFVDMDNCVFADEHDILDKLAHLFRHRDELERITDSGYRLVHSRHTLKHRAQIFDWFRLNTTRQADQTIVQLNPFVSPVAVHRASGTKHQHLVSNGLHLQLLRRGDSKLWAGQIQEAERLYLRCLEYMRWMPEPKLRLVLCSLYRGDARAALRLIEEQIHFVLHVYKAADPDPVEWAYLVISLLCSGRIDDASARANQFPSLQHPELERARWVVRVLKNRSWATTTDADDMSHSPRPTIHKLPYRTIEEWVTQLRVMLVACRQQAAAQVLIHGVESNRYRPDKRQWNTSPRIQKAGTPLATEGGSRRAKRRELFFVNRGMLGRKARLRLGKYVAGILHRLEAQFGYFLPYRVSQARSDEFFKAIHDLASSENIKTVLVIGATPRTYLTEAFLAGAHENSNRSTVFCIASVPRHAKRRSTTDEKLSVAWIDVTSEDLVATIRRITSEHQIECFDALVFDGSQIVHQAPIDDALNCDALRHARVIIIDDLNMLHSYNLFAAISKDSSYSLLGYDPDVRNGYAILRRDKVDQALDCAAEALMAGALEE
jgi:hypothetical protein